MADTTETRSDDAQATPVTRAGAVSTGESPATQVAVGADPATQAAAVEGRARPVATRAGRVPAGNGRPEDPDDMRQEIQRTRARMSLTLDTIEARLVEQKREIWARATLRGFRHRVTSEPWRSLAIAFAAGYIVAAIRD